VKQYRGRDVQEGLRLHIAAKRKAKYWAALTIKYEAEGRKAEAKKAKGHALRWTREMMRLEGKL
jgi:hypothetical protein